ncbi:J domain-containing protein [Natronorubrum aibiense]|uniref:DnaJ domain-containing protein n=1 Tax=Natronorubrum aibiense TaxID=348826 RepID=A0A5P9P7F6_9EURY|nr:DnaJ domain-containing protein [Natronorubrum aibiense]QFU83867.1 DnaJ domain-containing protein [Natronorubrum aibiense]
MTEDFYDLLEIPSNASQDEIKDAYREQVRVYHPDHNDDDRARAQFTAVKKAYDILGDPVERKAYDRMGHTDYVAKRTSGLPSADVWQSSDSSSSDESKSATSKTNDADDEADETSSGTTFTYSSSSSSSGADASSASTSSSKRSKAASAAGATGGATSRTQTGSGTGTASRTSTGTTSSGATGTGTASAGTSTTQTNTHNGGSTSTTASHGTGRSTTEPSGTASDSATGNPLTRWWRRQNFSLPLIWLSVCLYVAGLVHYGLENEAGLETLAAELQAVGTDPDGLWTALSSSRYGLETTTAFLARVELVAPPLETLQWYAALAGVVGVTVLGLLGARVVRDGETWGPVSIDETIVVAVVVAVTTSLVGGPLLAGAVLMPVLFTVIVRHTRRGPGWTPSYLYVLPVLAPAVGVGLATAGYATLPIDLLAFVIFPIVGALGLPLRATIRKRFGR